MFVANVVDTGLFRALGKPPTDAHRRLERAVASADATLSIPPTVYRELGGDPDAETFPTGSEYVDDAI